MTFIKRWWLKEIYYLFSAFLISGLSSMLSVGSCLITSFVVRNAASASTSFTPLLTHVFPVKIEKLFELMSTFRLLLLLLRLLLLVLLFLSLPALLADDLRAWRFDLTWACASITNFGYRLLEEKKKKI